MARSDIQQRMEALRGTPTGLIMVEFLKDRLDSTKDGFLSCTEKTFQTQQGRCQELQSLIKFLETKG